MIFHISDSYILPQEVLLKLRICQGVYQSMIQIPDQHIFEIAQTGKITWGIW